MRRRLLEVSLIVVMAVMRPLVRYCVWALEREGYEVPEDAKGWL